MNAPFALTALAALSALAVLIYGPWQEACTAYARQVVFEKRDTIFDLAASGHLSFNDPNYKTIRVLLEKSIRFAHEVTIPRLLYYYIVLGWHDKRIDKPELIKAVERIQDAETRDKVSRLVRESLDALILMAVAKSPMALIVLLPSCLPFYIIVVVGHIGRSFSIGLLKKSAARRRR